MLGLLPLIEQCSFYARVSSLNIFLGYEKSKALKLDPKTLTIPTKKPCEEFLIFIIYIYHKGLRCNTHQENFDEQTKDRKTRKQMTEISKIPFIDLKIYPSCLKLCEIYWSNGIFHLIYLLEMSSEVSILAFQR